MGKLKKSLFSTGITLFVCYVGVCIYFYNIQTVILFKPYPLHEEHQYGYSFDFEERYFDVSDGEKIHAIHAKVQDSAKGLVIYFHGNAGNNDTNPIKFNLFMDQNYDVLYPDYRGFGKSTGKLKDEDDLIGDMKTVYSEMLEEYDEENIFIVGYSMGSGVAAQVAAANNPKGVMIWTPYYSMIDMKDAQYPFLPSFLMKFPLRTDLAIQEIEEPITIFYAENDEVLPVNRALKLNEFLDENDQYFILKDHPHYGVYRSEEVQSRIAEILERKS